MSESPSSGKASGKTATLSAYLDWFEDATGINDSDPKEWHELRERIEELEAELASERTLAETAWRANADLVAANEKAEAEVERLRNGEIFTERQFRALEKAGWRLEEKGDTKDRTHCWRCDPYYPHGCKCECHARVNPSGDTPARIADMEAELAKWKRCYEIAATAAQEYEARAEKAEAEVQEAKKHVLMWHKQFEKAEAGVERLRAAIAKHDWLNPDCGGVNPSGDTLGGGGRESGGHGASSEIRAASGRAIVSAAAEPAVCCEDYPYCGHDMVKQPDGSWKHVPAADPAARKERDG